MCSSDLVRRGRRVTSIAAANFFAPKLTETCHLAGLMKGELTAVIEPAPEGGFWAICLEIPGANGQGESMEEARKDLQAAIELLLEDREADISRGLPPDAVRMPLQIG